MSYKPYPKYKPSGVEWIGDIPERWHHKFVKFTGNAVLGKMLTNSNKGGYSLKPYLRAKNILWEHVDKSDINQMWFSEKELSQYRVEKNDLLISEGGEVGRTAIWDNELDECYLQNSVHKFTVNSDENSRFHLYQLGVLGKQGYFKSIVNRVSIGHLTCEKLGSIPLVSPPITEQTKIAAFLDRKTAQIDKLIEIKRKQIELLKEERTAIINQAVTKGLNPAAKMKDSGIEWIGEIPEGWKALRLGREIKLQRGIDITKNVQVAGDIPVVSSGGISSYHNQAFAKGPGVIVGRKGTLGKVHFVNSNYWPHDTTLWVKEFRGNYPRFVYYKLRTLDLEHLDTGSSNPTLNRNEVHPIYVAWPPQNEQEVIATHLDAVEKMIGSSISNAEQQIKLLQEYRTTLISDTVTGKIDIREEAA